MELTIGILSYNTKELTERCINSILKFTKNITYEIIVIDNGSLDGSASYIKKTFPQVDLVANKKNKFFARGYNQVIKRSKGKYLIMLNSDAYLENNAFKKIIDFMKTHNLNACEGLELKPSKKPISTGSLFRSLRSDFYELSLIGRMFRNEKYIARIRLKQLNRRKSFEVDVGCNAYFCVETKLIKDIGGYDGNFILYYTEDDISQRIKARGFKIYHCGDSYVVHDEAKSTTQLGLNRVNIFYRDLLTYHLKYNSKFYAYILFFVLTIEKYFLRMRGLK